MFFRGKMLMVSLMRSTKAKIMFNNNKSNPGDDTEFANISTVSMSGVNQKIIPLFGYVESIFVMYNANI